MKLLLTLYNSASPNPSSVKSLLEVTFPGRYAELHNNDSEDEITPADFILNRCPFLRETEYVCCTVFIIFFSFILLTLKGIFPFCLVAFGF